MTAFRTADQELRATRTSHWSNILANIDPAGLFRMRDRAYLEATRAWSEYRANGVRTGASARMLLDAAWSAEDYWRHLSDACKERGRS